MLIEESIKDIITRLNNIKWFENCEKGNAISKYEISYAKNIDSVIKHCSSTRWANLILERRQIVSSYLTVYRVNTLYKWNEVVLEIKKNVIPILLQKVEEKWREKYDVSDKIIMNIRSDMVRIIALYVFREYKIDPFHEEILNIYEQGYLPCGWKGTYPEGKIIIF